MATPSVPPPLQSAFRRVEEKDVSPKTSRRSKSRPTAGGAPRQEEKGSALYPHELRPGDRFTDEQGVELELLSQPIKVVGAQEFTTTARRSDRPAEVQEVRWRAHERVRVRRT